jgi:hypothetical protein
MNRIPHFGAKEKRELVAVGLSFVITVSHHLRR